MVGVCTAIDIWRSIENVAPGEVLRNGGSGVKEVGEGGIKRRQDWSHQTNAGESEMFSSGDGSREEGASAQKQHAQTLA